MSFPAGRGVLLAEEAAPQFIDPRRRWACLRGGCVCGVSVRLEDDDGVGGGVLGYSGVAARCGSAAGSDHDGHVVAARSDPLTPPLLPLASGGQGAGGGGGSSDGGSDSGSGGGGDARGGAEPSGRA